MKKKHQIMKTIMFIIFIFITPNVVVFADSVLDDQVTVEGKISFRDNIEIRKDESNLFSNLPQTGEIMNYYWIFGFILIVSILFLIYFRKRGDKP